MKTCGKLAKLVHMFPKNAKNNSFSIWLKFIYDSIYGNLWVISLSLSLSPNGALWSTARQVKQNSCFPV